MEVPFNLSTLRKHLANVAFARRVLPEDVAARQKLLEESVYDIATARLQHESNMLEEIGLGGEKTLRTTQLKRWMWQWHQKLEERLTNDIQELIKQEEIMTAKRSRKDERLGPFLSLLKPSKLSLITILELMHLSGSGGVNSGMKTARALLTVGKAVELEYKAEMCRRNDIQIPQASSTFASKSEIEKKQRGFFTGLGYRELHARRVAAARYVQEAEEWTSEWTQELKVRVGSFLVDTLMDVATVERTAINKVTGQEVTEEHPAFYHSYEYMKGHKLGIIRLNPVVAERMAKDNLRDTLHPRHLPMLVKPKPWLDHNQGGYIYNKTSAMRFKESREQEVYLAHASAQGHVELVYAGLDVLGSTPWVINRDVFDIVLQVWNSGERFAKIPPAAFDGPEPERPGEGETDPHKKTIYITRAKQYAQDKASNHSERCNVNYKIEIARAFLGDTFYLPHNLDFRGRAYPIPPHLNHIGDDLARGLLKFGESRPLGERGLRWLKIHLANLYGYDKASFDERVNWVHERMEQIYDSATKPLDGQRWWTHADDPWQCLATCKELHAALESPDPLAFESSLPVHQDGTCNGLQHYAALGGDSIGAAQVNLAVTDRPSDVYTYVANMVEREIEDDIKKPDNKWAKMLQGKIARKVVKQTVMTTVYGVTFIGARDQLEKQLKDRGDIPVEDCWHAASYLAKKTLDCIGDLFRGAKDIQNWLNLSARLISKSIPPDRLELAARTASKRRKGIPIKDIRKEQMTSVIWTTPLGLPIVQPYRQTQRRQILTSLQTVFISDPNMAETVNSTKQASAFPPNFVHSLDATHMMLTALECRSQGLTFASVHDSYWTHASTIDEMSGIIRDTFVALHSSDVLAKLREEFVERYKDFKVPVISLRTPQMLKKLGMSESALVAAARASRGVELDTTEDADKEPANDLGESNEAEAVSENRFINLVDLLPPLPKKGDFNVETIKKSLYFFS
ncbi:DNA/RNA polymerase [Punctularia strigosozonata HHB-11173 SS5]|uniref:DNA/RNA polymerase n=1 Tax=Punctularia strigosozonata (strain HHB-11173) TaxID=741275 RepID=UPI00044166A1|nr:DNA/RNA polymerase [Punctularia strigosozonata HHB-11173 SS5]EIN05775.1 DNA/RNA polymerase [Punctularia strigosozonata HHB-11173 SS5]